jgi:hypothetical protein
MRKRVWTVIGVLALIVVFGIVTTNQFSIGDLSKNQVYLPVFSNTECGVISSNHLVEYDFAQKDQNKWASFYCSRNDHDVYTNRCNIEFRANDGSFIGEGSYINEVHLCPIGATFEEKEERCSQIHRVAGGISYESDEYMLVKATDRFGFGNLEEGDVTVRVLADWYGLRSIDSNNYLSKEVTCDISRITGAGYTLFKSEKEDKAPSGILPFNQVINYVSAVSPAVSKNVITYKGQTVYTTGNQVAYPVVEDVSGNKFVDLLDPIVAKEIVCNPALPFCSDDGTQFINLDGTDDDGNGKSCNELYGSFLNQYVPNPEDSSEVCKSRCNDDGELERRSCKDIPTCSDGQTLNSKYECVGANVPVDNGSIPADKVILYIAIGVVAIALIMIVVRIAKDKKGGRKR